MAVVSQRFLRDGRGLPPELEAARVEIEALARGHGLDFFETVFVMCTYEEINMIASYGGFPTRYPHWRFGMDYLQMQKSYEFGLSKIYEMVINTDPSYAYLMDCNLPVDQKLVMAHVFGHVDFFKNNAWFAHTNRKMLDQMANHATKVERIIDRQGQADVERFLEMCVSLDNLVDPYAPHIVRQRVSSEAEVQAAADADVSRLPASDYMDPFINPPEFLEAQRERKARSVQRMRRFPESPDRDVLGFLLRHAPLERWQRELMQVVYDEACYFQPQAMTKIMNEGWASYWHTKMMTQHILTDAEVVDYADHNAGTMSTRPGQLNPYALGVKLWRHVEERWDKGRFGKDWMACDDPMEQERWDTGAGLGRDKIFEVRRTHNDVSFVDTFLTEDFVRQHGMFTTRYDARAKRWVVDSDGFREVKQQVLTMLATRGAPRILVLDADAFHRGELLLDHPHEGLDLQLDYAREVLGNMARIWSRPVHLQTRLDDKPVTLSHDGEELKKVDGHLRREDGSRRADPDAEEETP
ncbi:MAG: SpoVR family protein [Alphaproteobacteria bacterium]|nr:SpoVR family protein [Alphaproteobacteria bacterium]